MPELNWMGKEAVENYDKQVPYKTLKKKYTFPNNDIESQNMIIHGDNLEALKALLPKYESRIKCIYIDPPYNTGNEQWVYNDNVNSPRIQKWLNQVVGKEGEDFSRHDKWLCMMYPRLVLLRQLLSNDGAIFISIDDNEQANLKLILDKIFGERNFVGQIVVENDSRARPYNSLSITHEYIIAYKKTDLLTFKILVDENKKFQYKDDEGGFDLYELRNRNSDFNIDNRPNLYYPFWVDENSKDKCGLYKIDLIEHEGWIKFYPQESQGIKTVWRWGREKSQENLNKVIFGKKSTRGWQVVKKYRNSSYSLNTVWTDTDISSDRGTLVLKKYFNNKRIFAFPKPPSLVERCLKFLCNSNDIILDSFAGSGTTAHAVLNLNKKDGGNRKFILVEMEDYAETITAERVKRVINGYGQGNKKVEGTGGDFSFYELGEVLIKDGNLNEKQPIEKIQEYIWYTETRTPFKAQNTEYYLGEHENTAYYFFYKKDSITELTYDTWNIVKHKAEKYIIYADLCRIDKDDLLKYNILFKKIPRDIRKF